MWHWINGVPTFNGSLSITGTLTASGVTTSGTVTGGSSVVAGTTGYFINGTRISSGTPPTVTSAGTSPSVSGANTAAFRVDVGTGGTATTIVLSMPAATTGWNCFAENITAMAANRAGQRVVMVSSTTTSITVQNQTIATGAALAFTAGDIVAFVCTSY